MNPKPKNFGMENKKVWVLVRGLARAQHYWLDFPELVQKKFPEDQVLCLDLLGNGYLNQQQSPLHVIGYVESLREQLAQKRRDSQSSVYVIAISLGGMVVVEWMRQHPEEIHKSYLINTSCSNFAPVYQRLQVKSWGGLLRILSQSDISKREQLILEMISRSPAQQQKWHTKIIEIATKYPVQMKNFLRQLWVASKAEFPEKPPGQITLFCAQGDLMVNPKSSEAIAERWKCPLYAHPWAGHDLPFDDPQWIVDRLSTEP